MTKKNLNLKKQKIQKNNLKKDYLQEDFFLGAKSVFNKVSKKVGGEKHLVNKGGTPFVFPFGTRGKRLNECEGDCDVDGDCKGSLKCFQRNGNEKIPGCKKGGSGDKIGYDYCYDPKLKRKPAGKKVSNVSKKVSNVSKKVSKVSKKVGGEKRLVSKGGTPFKLSFGTPFKLSFGTRGEKRLVNKGGTPFVFPFGTRGKRLNECEGDCDVDGDCKGSLKCFQRNGNEKIPGCKKGGSGDKKGYDYCYDPKKEKFELTTSGTYDKSITKADCKRFSDNNGYKWYNKSYSNEREAPGCFLWNGSDIYYNTNTRSSGKCNHSRNLKCVKRKNVAKKVSKVSKNVLKVAKKVSKVAKIGARILKVTVGGSYGTKTKILECKPGKKHIITKSKAYTKRGSCGAHDQCKVEINDKCQARIYFEDRCTDARKKFKWSKYINPGESISPNKYCNLKIELVKPAAKNYIEKKSGKPSMELSVADCKKFAETTATFKWKGERTDSGNFPLGCNIYRYPGYEKNWGVYYYKAKRRPKNLPCGTAHTTCVEKNIVKLSRNLDSKVYSWDQANKYCKDKGFDLCGIEDYKKNGLMFGGQDSWSPYKDKNTTNNWVQTGNKGHAFGKSHNVFGKPPWNNSKNMPFKKKLLCCSGLDSQEQAAKKAYEKSVAKQKAAKAKSDAKKLKAAKADKAAAAKAKIEAKKPGKVIKKFDSKKQCAFKTGYTCVEDGNCESGWCHNWKCKNKYGYLQPSPGICGSSKECSGNLTCHLTKCRYKKNSRNVGQSCDMSDQCKKYGFGTAKGTSCCKGKCENKSGDWLPSPAYYCPHECRGAAAAPQGTCHLKDTKKYKNFKNGKTCLKNGNCKSGWCHNWKCRKTYGYLQPNPGICGSNVECADKNCVLTKCRYKKGSRKTGQSCEFTNECASGHTCFKNKCYHWPRHVNEPCVLGTDCKGFDILVGKGTNCCGGICKNKVEHSPFGYWCPNMDKSVNLGGKCGKTSHCKRGTCCQGKCQNKVRDWAGNYFCPHEVKCRWGKKGFLGSCTSGSQCCSGRCNGYVAGHWKNVKSNCWGKCHSDKKSCRGGAIRKHVGYHKVGKNWSCSRKGGIGGPGILQNKKTWGCRYACPTWSNPFRTCSKTCSRTDKDGCWGECHPSGKGCRGGAIYRTVDYHKVGSNKFNNQSCRSGYLYGRKWVPKKTGSCSR